MKSTRNAFAATWVLASLFFIASTGMGLPESTTDRLAIVTDLGGGARQGTHGNSPSTPNPRQDDTDNGGAGEPRVLGWEPVMAEPGEVLTLRPELSGTAQGPLDLTVSWGDGTRTVMADLAAGVVSLPHEYAQPGSYRVTATVCAGPAGCNTRPIAGVGIGGEPPGPYFEAAEREAGFAELERLEGIQSRHTDDVMSRPGVYAFGITLDRATAEPVFLIRVDEQKPRPALPEQIEGVAVLVESGVPPVAFDTCTTTACHANQLSLPVAMGNSGRHGNTCSGACTMGFKACDLDTLLPVFVTNAHCTTDASTCPGTATQGDAVYHPSPGDAGGCFASPVVGAIAEQVAPQCLGPPLGFKLDAATVSSTGIVTLPTIRDIGVPSTVPGLVLWFDTVQKSGRTSGFTLGVVNALNVTTTMCYNCCAFCPTLVGQIEIAALGGISFSQPGDSGAAVLDMDNPPRIAGLLVGGSTFTTYANQALDVLSAFNLDLDITKCVEFVVDTDEPCTVSFVSTESDKPGDMVTKLRLLRDAVLGSSELGKSWIRRFYSNTASWVGLYRERPALLRKAAKAFDSNVDIVSALVARRSITISPRRLEAATGLLDAHIAAAEDAELRQAFERWRREINDAEVQAAFGIKIR